MEDKPADKGVSLREIFGWKNGIFRNCADPLASTIRTARHIAHIFADDTAVAIDGRIVVEYFGRNCK